MRTRNALLAVAWLAATLPLPAQSSKEGAPQYRVEINFRDGNDANSTTDRRYAFLATDSRKTVFKAGTKSPAITGTAQAQSGNTIVNTEYTYLDVGVNIECFVVSAGSTGAKVGLHGSLDLSNIAGDASLVAGVRNPIIRQTKLELDALMELGKPTVLASIDDPLTARKLQVEATITKAN